MELFLPLETPPQGTPFPEATFDRIKGELTESFLGVTAFLQAPAKGAWKPSPNETVHDRVAVLEVMVEDVDPQWWHRYRIRLEQDLQQDQVLIRLYQVTVL